MSTKSPPTIAEVLAHVPRPRRAVVTAGMPYANGPLHVGHLAGAHLPADIYARWLGLVVGRENVLFVNGTDDHGSTSEFAAMKQERPVRDFIEEVHAAHVRTLARYAISVDIYSGTSRPDCFALQKEFSDWMLGRLLANGMLEKRTSEQWYDPELDRFLADRFVRGICPHCGADDAYGDQCNACGKAYDPSDLKDPRSAVSKAVPSLRETVHLYLDMWRVAEVMRDWVESRQRTWRHSVVSVALDYLMPSLRVTADREDAYKAIRNTLPHHKQRYARGGEVVLQMKTRADFAVAHDTLGRAGIVARAANEWAYRAITRDTPWGIPVDDVDPDLRGKTLYVWPDSLIAPISFTKLALEKRGDDVDKWRDFWCEPDARIVQFLGQDNVFFYVLMQGAMWLGSQDDPERLPLRNELQLTDVFGCYHLMVGGEKMSKTLGNFYSSDELIDDRAYDPDQIRYYLAVLGLEDKTSDFDFAKLDERNAFLAGPMNAAFEKPISACHSKFGGVVPQGELDPKAESETVRIVRRYTAAMQRASYPSLIYEIERYARRINTLFAQYKPHDDRYAEKQRADALYSSFYILKNLIIMLYPFVPSTVERVRESLNLPREVLRIDQLGTGIKAGHAIGRQVRYFPDVDKRANDES